MSDELVAVIDLETSGLDPEKDQVLETCWAIVDVPTAQVVELHSVVHQADANPAEAVNGLPLELLRRGTAPAAQLPPVELPEEVTAILAHNAAFDSRWGRFEEGLPWLCTMEDFRWPRAEAGLRLVDLALAHGVGVVSAHRAYADVLTLCAVLARAHETRPLAELLADARRPRATYLSLAPFEAKDVVKAAGFRWFPEVKQWRRRMLPEEAAALPFKTRQVQP